MNVKSDSARRLRVLALERESGRPLAAIPIVATAQLKGGQEIALGALASDHAGFVSFDLTAIDGFLDAVEHLWVHRLGDQARRVDAGAPHRMGPFAAAIPILTEPLPFDPRLPRPQLPSIQGFDPQKCFVSPNSFFTNPRARLGEGGCEILLPSNSATHEFRFRQVVRTLGDKQVIRQPDSDNPNKPGDTVDEFWTAETLTLPRGYVMEYKVTWYPLGHSLGRLLYSLPLAPCESVNLAVIDWSRRDEATRDEAQTLTEDLVHAQRRDRMVEETVRASLDEWQGGGSLMGGVAGSYGADAGMSISGTIGGSYASSGGERDLAASTVQKLADNIVQASNVTRTLRSTVVVQASQREREVIETRTVTNHNHCHAMTVLYYEVLRHYRVVTECVSKQRVLFVSYDVQAFDRQTAFCARLILERVLLDARLRKCFDAVERLLYCTPPELLEDAAGVPAAGAPIRQMLITLVTADATDYTVVFKLRLSNGDILSLNLGDEHFAENERHTFTWDLPDGVRAQDITRVGLRFQHDNDIFEGEWRARSLLVRYVLQDDDERHILYEKEGKSHFKLLEADGAEWWDEIAAMPSPKPLEQARQRARQDLCCADRLLAHLNCHKVYYRNALWLLEDPNARVHRLRTQSPYKEVRLLKYIENRAVGAFGDMIAFPELGEAPQALTDDEGNAIEPVLQCVALPTHGVFAEAELGRCNACEEKDITRFWNWSESPCPDKAPPIEPISAGSRYQAPDVQPAAMPSPVVNIVNPPGAPEPSGLAAALSVLATPNIFRDLSGLQEVSALLQALAQGSMSLEQARQQAQQIQARQPAPSQLVGLPPQEQHDQNMVTRSSPELSESERADRVRRTVGLRRVAPAEVEPSPAAPTPPDARMVELRLRAFVPSPIWEPGFGFPLLGLAHAALLLIRFNGDGRGFSLDGGSSRADLPVRLQVDANDLSVISFDEGRLGHFGEAEVYLASDTQDIEGGPEWAERKDEGVRPWLGLAGQLPRTPQNMAATVTSEPGTLVVSLKIAARAYFPFAEEFIALLPDVEIDLGIGSFDAKDALRAIIQAGLPDIDADLRIRLSKREDGELQYQVSGAHDGFPAWELYVNGEVAYQFDPRINLAEPDLAPQLLLAPSEQHIALATAPVRRID